jgi:hypothetical protein
MKKIISIILALLVYLCGIAQNVGIGTSTPSSKLEVIGTSTSSNLVLKGSGNGNANDFLIKSNASGLISSRKGHGALGMNYLICTSGVFIGPSTPGSISNSWLGEIKLFAANYSPPGWALCNGQLLDISGNEALFAIIGNYYGGNGVNNFAIPDLRGATPVSFGTPAGGGNTWNIGERTQ